MRPATTPDAPAVRTLLARAFAADPLLTWMFPDAATRPDAAAAFAGVHVERYLARADPPGTRARVVDGDAGVVGAALWRWPEDDLGAAGQLPTPAGLLVALVGTAHARTVADGFAELQAARPTAPHAYLHYLAVDAAERGRGVGRRLVAEGVARATADDLPVLLETAAPANVAFYARLGFGVAEEVRLGDGPVCWVLTRPRP